VTAGWKNLHNEELRDLCPLPSIIRLLKVRKMRSARHAANMWRSGMPMAV
jgi:hypothetical protein